MSIFLLLWSTPCSSYSVQIKPKIKLAVFLSSKFELGPGSVINRVYHDIDFPRGHIALKSFNGEVVDEVGNPIPLHETYLHHWGIVRYYQSKNATQTRYESRKMHEESDNVIDVRNSGICQENTLLQYFGLGSETRGTMTDIPDPFGIEIGNPAEIPEGFEEKWLVNIHAIDTRGAEDKVGCIECKCDLYNVTVDEYGKAIRPEYKGGLLCCYDYTQCKLKDDFEGPKRNLYLRYTVKWIDWDDFVVPVKIYIIDVTDSLKLSDDSKGMNSDHSCEVEYHVEACNTDNKEANGCVHVKRTSLPLKTGGYVIYGVAHQHLGAIESTLYGQDGRVICSSIPSYGNGNEAGNEVGYLIGMSTCYPKPGSVKIIDGEILTIESIYNNTKEHTGVMGLFYLYVAEQLPYQHFRHSIRSSFFMDVNNIFLDK
ncbi:stress up-regulated Nod 19 protein [Trifolium repens]|nr:stress up-regulated Nod 19 protein [Trifolium repens]